MSLMKISETDKIREKCIEEKLFHCIDSSNCFAFNSGAGAGKTYALVQCLKYVVVNYGEDLKNNNQKIMCITYTNVAANHIKESVGNSDLIQVSTIHERIWSLIKRHQSELVKIHIEKLQREIEEIYIDLEEDKKYEFYRNVDEEKKEQLTKILLDNKELFYESYSFNAQLFKEKMHNQLAIPIEMMNNVGHFKTLVGKLYKIEKYNNCLESIKEKKKGYSTVEYNPIYNSDRLERMRISHDTLLEYGEKLIVNYPRMMQIIIDQYPYIFIDEYQDTAERVVRIMNTLDRYSKEISHPLVVGYYGDTLQNIYDDGVGEKLIELHKDLVIVTKEYNRRSHKEIIDVANMIRNDSIKQKSIYTDCNGGCVEFFYGSNVDIKSFINEYASRIGATCDNSLHCLFTTNQLVAEYSGFETVYRVFKESSKYKGFNYQQLNTELLGDDDIKLGNIANMLSRMIQLYIDVNENLTPLRKILKSEEWREVTLVELRSVISELKKIEGDTVGMLLKKIFDIYDNTSDDSYHKIIDNVFDFDDGASYRGVVNKIAEELFSEENDIELKLNEFLDISLIQLKNWHMYRRGYIRSDKQYHTYHSTKGLEFNNVIIILEKGFGKEKGYFENFFKEYANCNPSDLYKYNSARNLLYVAVTRAIKNLLVLYLEDITDIKENIEKIFDVIKKA